MRTIASKIKLLPITILLFLIAIAAGIPKAAIANAVASANMQHHDHGILVNNTLRISNVWARKSFTSQSNSAVYMMIENITSQQVTMIGANAESVAGHAELHTSFIDEQGISRMVAVDKIIIPAHSTVHFAPGGMHIMLFDLNKMLVPDEQFDLTIKFKEIPFAHIRVIVQ